MADQNSDRTSDHELDALLAFREPLSADAFVLDVMHRVQRERRRRKWILLTFGVVGAGFGAAGALLLSDAISHFFTSLPLTGTMQAVLIAVAAVAFYGWFMNEDISLDS
jgi:hypothetical protein